MAQRSRRHYPTKSRLKPPTPTKRSRPNRTSASRAGRLALSLKALLAVTILFGGYLYYLNAVILEKFQGKRWALPAHVYARPLELYPGMRLGPEQLEEEVRALGYRPSAHPDGTGQFQRSGSSFELHTRGFRYWDGPEPPRHLRLRFQSKHLLALEEVKTHHPVGPVRLEPLRIGGIYPTHQEDRVLVRVDEVPPLLTEALIAMEDREFFQHDGISLRGIARALWANLRAGQLVQGGSTLTQQLVKNYFLTSDRSLWRKLQEALMAILLELHYNKQEILEAYLNEVHLGQDGSRAIHGFGLASHFYFGQPINELQPPQLALLVALARGPSYYNPRRHAERARARRNRVLDELTAQKTLPATIVEKWRTAPLGITEHPPGGASPYPAFMDLVRRQLQRDYREEDLTSEGLQIITTLDPRVQRAAEKGLQKQLQSLERHHRLSAGSLEGAAVVTGTEDGEVLAIVGGRETRFAGFNHALDAVRPIGSLIKPAVYLTALASGKYTLTSPLQDVPVRIAERNGRIWAPDNYDGLAHGSVPLHLALAKSYNLATARLGLSLGIPQILEMLHELGVERRAPAYPALLLGAMALSPIEVTQMYQTLAAGGFRTPVRAIRDVFTAEGTPLKRYPLAVKQVVSPAAAYLMTSALQEVVRSGTGRGLASYLPAEVAAAGKTGTTDLLRDSWFAGFTGNYLAVIWVGRDDNRPAQLTGAEGALTVWGTIMQTLDPEPLRPVQPPDVEHMWVDKYGQRTDADCVGAAYLPFAHEHAPLEHSPCVAAHGEKPINSLLDRVRDVFR